MELGNHSYSHPDLHDTPLEPYQRDVMRGALVTSRILASAGRTCRYFRHPFLHTGRDLATRDAFHAFLTDHGYEVAPVTIDNQEWIAARAYDHALIRTDTELARRIATTYVDYMSQVFAYYEQQSRALLDYELPQVLLIHANRLNAAAIDQLLTMISDRGYEFVALAEALRDPAYDLPDRYHGPAGITWLHRWALTAGAYCPSANNCRQRPPARGWNRPGALAVHEVLLTLRERPDAPPAPSPRTRRPLT